MMYSEFTQISGLEIDFNDYTGIIEPMYTATKMTKTQFIEFIKPSAKVLATNYAKKRKAEMEASQKLVFVETDGKTPNGAYSIGYYAKLVDTNIATGKFIVRNLTPEEFEAERTTHNMYWHGDSDRKAQGLGYNGFYADEVILKH